MLARNFSFWIVESSPLCWDRDSIALALGSSALLIGEITYFLKII